MARQLCQACRYYAALLNDSLRGNTRGAELTYYSNDDRLLVNGSSAKPAISHIRKKHPQ